MAANFKNFVLSSNGASVPLDCVDTGTAGFVITTSADWNGTLEFQASEDATNYNIVGLNNINTHQETQTFTTANTTATFRGGSSPYETMRVVVTAYVAGTATLSGRSSSGSSVIELANLPDGKIVTLGFTTDAAVTSDTNATLMGFSRGLVKILSSVWDGANALYVKVAGVVGVTNVNRSGTITSGGTAQQLCAANAARKRLFIQNVSTGLLWINFTTTAVQDQPSFRLEPYDTWFEEGSSCTVEAVSIIGATTGQAWTAKEA